MATSSTAFKDTIGLQNNVISDRLYNVEQIALASMGVNSIVDDEQKVRTFRVI